MGWPMWAWLGGPRFWSARAGQVHNGTIRAERLVTRQQGFFPDGLTQTAGHRFRFTGPIGPVPGENRLNSNPNSNKFKRSRATGSDRFTGRFDRYTCRLDRFTIQFGRYTGDLDGPVPSGISADYSGLPAGLAGIPVVSSSFPTLKKWIPV